MRIANEGQSQIMPATVTDLEDVIRRQFPGAEVEVTERSHRLSATIRWTRFKRMSMDNGFRLVKERVRDEMGFRGLNVGTIYPLAPGESL